MNVDVPPLRLRDATLDAAGVERVWRAGRDPADAAPGAVVVVPVYAGLAETLACLASLARAADGSEVIVIDDASPDATLSAAVAAFCAKAGFTHRRNRTNLGFPATANRGLRMRPGCDVALLNADTEVPPGWLARLRAVAASDPRIATVTPLSNNATIMSLPAIGGSVELPYGLSLEQIDALCERLHDGRTPDLPTAHGFCMFIRRAALRELGGFDARRFGRGYAEENDFSLRARKAGWRNVAAPNVFVRHAGAVSFGAAQTELLARNLAILNRRHPGYDADIAAFIAEDPLRAIRRRVQLALWRARGRPVVMVTNALPGGTERHVRALSRAVAESGRPVLWVQAQAGEEDGTILLREPPDADGRASATVRYGGATGASELLADLFALDPVFVHVHHLIDLPPEIPAFLARAGIPYVVTAHDYFLGCPRVTLLDEGGTFCGAPAAPLCRPCLASPPAPHPALHPGWRQTARDGEIWRARWGAFLAGAAQVIVPSRAAAHWMTRLFPGLRCDVRPHAASQDGVSAPPPGARRDPFRVAVIGAVGPHKGAEKLAELARWCHREAPEWRLVVIGHTDRDAAFAQYGNVELAGPYRPEDAQAAIAAAGCATALFLSPWPETYCFALSEALLAGLVPVALDMGAIGERMGALGAGVLLPPDSGPVAIAAGLRDAAAMLPPAVRAIDAIYAALFADYYAGDGGQDRRAAAVLCATRGISGDAWCSQTFAMSVVARPDVAAMTLTVWTHPAHAAQRLTARLAGGSATTAAMTPGEISTLRLAAPDAPDGLLTMEAEFEFATPLGGGDVRRGAAKLVSATVELRDGTVRILE
jgi:GT2 family glycosyltransferase/glycosyltransferase involved in cell wall biosynthesis